MTPIPTLHLRFVERLEYIKSDPTGKTSTARTVRVLQQFWSDPDGNDVCGDMFKMSRGVWRDVPLEQQP